MAVINAEGLELVKRWEGLRLNAYPDPASGGDPWTIGYGHTSAAGLPKVVKGMKITKEEAEAILVRDLIHAERAIAKFVKVPLNNNQHSALASFIHNLGEGNFSGSTLLKKINAKDWAGAAKEFPRWNRAAGKVMKGLTDRRNDEARLFLKAGSTSPVQTVNPTPVVVTPTVPKPSEEPTVGFWGAIWTILVNLFSKGNK